MNFLDTPVDGGEEFIRWRVCDSSDYTVQKNFILYWVGREITDMLVFGVMPESQDRFFPVIEEACKSVVPEAEISRKGNVLQIGNVRFTYIWLDLSGFVGGFWCGYPGMRYHAVIADPLIDLFAKEADGRNRFGQIFEGITVPGRREVESTNRYGADWTTRRLF